MKNTTIDMKAIHKEFCKKNKIKYSPKNMVKDLSWNCFAVATVLSELLASQGTFSRAVYGIWHGHCVGKGTRAHRHGWVVIGHEIWDPTRFVFEGKKPYLFKSYTMNQPEYDEGMRLFRQQNRGPFPVKGEGQLVEIKWSLKVNRFLKTLIGKTKNPQVLTASQLMWIANSDYLELGEHIMEIYTKLIENNLGAFIPTDYKAWWNATSGDLEKVNIKKIEEKGNIGA